MLKELAAKEVATASEFLGQATKELKDAKDKHDMLEEYRKDYIRQMENALKAQGLGAEAYQNFNNFLKKLEQAIVGQSDIVVSAEVKLKIQREHWQECQRKKLSYEVLLDRAEKKKHVLELKKDQKMMDEFAMRKSRVQR